MSVKPIDVPWIAKPPAFSELDYAHPAVPHLIKCITMDAGRHLYDHVFGELGVQRSTGLVPVATVHGSETLFNNISAASFGSITLNSSITVIGSQTITSVRDQALMTVGAQDLLLWADSFSSACRFGYFAGSAFFAGTGSFSLNNRHIWGLRGNQSLVNMYAGGNLLGSSDIGGWSTASQTLYVGSNQSSDKNHRGNIGFIYVFDEDIGDELFKSITKNPWQIFKPRKLWVPAPPAATHISADTDSRFVEDLDAVVTSANSTEILAELNTRISAIFDAEIFAGQDVVISATVFDRILEDFQAVVVIGQDVHILATTDDRLVSPQDAVIAQVADTLIAAQLDTRTGSSFDASIFAGTATVITADTSERIVESFNSQVQLGNDVNIAADTSVRNVDIFDASITALVDTLIAALNNERVLSDFDASISFTQDTNITADTDTRVSETFDAAVVASVDTHIQALVSERTLSTLDAQVFAGQATHILAEISERVLTEFNAQVQLGLDVNINADIIERNVENLLASVTAIVDLEIAATVSERLLDLQNAEISTATQLLANTAGRDVLQEDAVVNADIPTAIVATAAQRTVSEFNATITSDLETHIQASLVHIVTEAFDAAITAQQNISITADTDFRIIDDTDAQVFAGADTHIGGTVFTRTVTDNDAVVVGIGGLALSATLSVRNLEAFDAIVFPGLVIKASTAERVLSVFDADIFNGHLVALVDTRNVVDYLANLTLVVNPDTTFASKGVESLTATITLQADSAASLSTRNLESLDAVISFGNPLNITSSTARRKLETFRATVVGVQVIECNIEDLNLTIPHAILDPQEQQRVLIENFMLLQECFRQLQAFMLKCCAAKGTHIFAQVADRFESTRDAFVDQVAVGCIYQDYVSTRGFGGTAPQFWWKMNDIGTPPSLLDPDHFNKPMHIRYVDPEAGNPTNNFLTEQPSVITQAGTTSVSFNSTAFEASPILRAWAQFEQSDTGLHFQFDFWVRLGEGALSAGLTNTLDINWVDGGKIFAIMNSSTGGDRVLESAQVFNAGDRVHIGCACSAFDFVDGYFQLYINGIEAGNADLWDSIFINGVYGNSSVIEDINIELGGGGGVGAIPFYVDQFAWSSQFSTNYMNAARMLETYNCGIGA